MMMMMMMTTTTMMIWWFHLYSAICIASDALYLLTIYTCLTLLPKGAGGSASWVSNTAHSKHNDMMIVMTTIIMTLVMVMMVIQSISGDLTRYVSLKLCSQDSPAVRTITCICLNHSPVEWCHGDIDAFVSLWCFIYHLSAVFEWWWWWFCGLCFSFYRKYNRTYQ